MTTFLVNSLGILLIGIIFWWFWLSKFHLPSTEVANLVEIKVKDGVYQPATIQAKVNQPITLRFIREDASPCAETVIFGTLKISKILPLYEPVDLFLTLPNPGAYEFTCQMGMYRGKLIVN